MTDIEKREVANLWKKLDQEHRERKNLYLDLLKTAKPEHVPQRTHLYTTAALELYIVQTRIQAAQSFNTAKYICIAGFFLLFVGAATAVIGAINTNQGARWAAVVITLGGVFTEFVAATVFVLHAKTMEQFNSNLARMAEAQKYAFEAILESPVENTNERRIQKPKRI